MTSPTQHGLGRRLRVPCAWSYLCMLIWWSCGVIPEGEAIELSVNFTIPPDAVDDQVFGSSKPLTTLVQRTLGIATLCPPRNLSPLIFQHKKRAIPTNAWWGNLIGCHAQDNDELTSANVPINPIWPNPFAIIVQNTHSPFGFALSYPYRSRVYGGTSGNADGIQFYLHGSLPDVTLSSVEIEQKGAAASNSGAPIKEPSFKVMDWDDLGVLVRMKPSRNATGSMDSYFVSGMAFLSANYTSLAPRIVFIEPVMTINGANYKLGNVYQASKFVVVCASGASYVVHIVQDNADGSRSVQDQTLQLTLSGAQSTVLESTSLFNGVIRVTELLGPDQEHHYDTYRDCVVQGGNVSILDDATYSFDWKTAGNCQHGLIHFAQPHHFKALDAASAFVVQDVTAHSATHGEMQAFATPASSLSQRWILHATLDFNVGFYPVKALTLAAAQEQMMLTRLRSDINAKWTIALTGSFYFNGKAAQKYASLCLMASDPVFLLLDKTLLSSCVVKLERVLAPLLDNSWTYPFQYEFIHGGIASSEGFKVNDPNADFGNSVYNDHHYHYGYWIQTAAIVNYLHPQWIKISALNDMVKLLLRDVVNPSRSDPYFPRFRNFDWFRGHSYSHGVVSLGDGKDEESTSEDINLWYGVYLYGKATKNKRLQTIGRLIARVDMAAIRTYFLLDNTNQVHPPGIVANKVTGIFFDNKVDYATWFSAEKYCIHGIQMIPVSPITEFVRSKQFVMEEWQAILGQEPIVVNEDLTNPWLSLLYTNYASIDKTKALNVLQSVSLDDGLTRSWALYMAATRS